MAGGNPSLVGHSFSGAGVKVFLVHHLDSCTSLPWCSVSFFLRALTQAPHGSKSRLWLSWVVGTNINPRAGERRAWGAGRNVSAEALWPEKVSGCFGGVVKETLCEHGAGDTVLKLRSSGVSVLCGHKWVDHCQVWKSKWVEGQKIKTCTPTLSCCFMER